MALYTDDASVDDGLWDCLSVAQTAVETCLLEDGWALVVADHLDQGFAPPPTTGTLEDSWLYRCTDLPAARALARELLGPGRAYVAVVSWREGDEAVFDGQIAEQDALAARWRTPIRRRRFRGPLLDRDATGHWELVAPLRSPTWTGSTWTLRDARSGETIADLVVHETNPPYLHAEVNPRPGREQALAEHTVAPPLTSATLHRPDGTPVTGHELLLTRDLGSWTVDLDAG